jgi:hypothetical protein
VIHPSSVAVSREHRRAKTDRLDTELLKRGFLRWLRGERGHCSMARVPTIAEEDAPRRQVHRGSCPVDYPGWRRVVSWHCKPWVAPAGNFITTISYARFPRGSVTLVTLRL